MSEYDKLVQEKERSQKYIKNKFPKDISKPY